MAHRSALSTESGRLSNAACRQQAAHHLAGTSFMTCRVLTNCVRCHLLNHPAPLVLYCRQLLAGLGWPRHTLRRQRLLHDTQCRVNQSLNRYDLQRQLGMKKCRRAAKQSSQQQRHTAQPVTRALQVLRNSGTYSETGYNTRSLLSVLFWFKIVRGLQQENNAYSLNCSNRSPCPKIWQLQKKIKQV